MDNELNKTLELLLQELKSLNGKMSESHKMLQDLTENL